MGYGYGNRAVHTLGAFRKGRIRGRYPGLPTYGFGSEDNTIKLWDLEQGRELLTLTGHSGSIKSVAITPDCRRAVSGAYDKTVRVWDLELGKELEPSPVILTGLKLWPSPLTAAERFQGPRISLSRCGTWNRELS